MISLYFAVHSGYTLVWILMTKVLPKDYRCSCGELLFRAEMVRSVVEVKCKRCGAVRVFGDTGGTDGFISFTFVTGTDKYKKK